MNAGLPIYRIVQQAGEFTVTFARAHHAEINLGFNITESLSILTEDFLLQGREVAKHFSKNKRSTIFSFEELVCQIALKANPNSTIASAAHLQLKRMVRDEEQLRNNVLSLGVKVSYY